MCFGNRLEGHSIGCPSFFYNHILEGNNKKVIPIEYLQK